MPGPRVLVVGAGLAGIGVAARLKQAGCSDLVVVEKNDRVGGTWRDNSYPGAACDVPSHLYSLSFAPGDWSHRFARQQEILGYAERVAREHGVTEHLRLRTEVRALEFDDDRGVWSVRLDGGEVLEADVVVSAVGQLNRPAVPALPGLDSFAGPSWHSARWRHDVDLTGRRVAVIGTGASAVQFVPEVARTAAEVTVYQRSAPYVLPRRDRAYSPGYRRLLRALPPAQRAARLGQYLRYESRALAFITERRLLALFRAQWQRLLEREIPDGELRARLTPDYLMGCKRILISNDWYPTLRQPHVRLVSDQVREVTARGVVTADGIARPADVLILGTGFRSLDFLQPMRVTGRGGRKLAERWHEGAEAYLGTMVAGFPNLFLLYGPNTNLGHNSIIYMVESQIEYVLDALRVLRRDGLAWLDVTEDAQRRWNDRLRRLSRASVFESGCSSWYTTETGRNTTNWPGYTFQFRRRTRRVDLADFEVRPARRPALPVPAAG